PSTPANGIVNGSSYKYGDVIDYSCHDKYNLTGGDVTRTCLSVYGNGYWSGNKPSCAYVKHCESNPCQNGATCVDGLDRYDCKCLHYSLVCRLHQDTNYDSFLGATSQISSLPISSIAHPTQPTSSKPKVTFDWVEPSFHDPMGTLIQLTQSYQKNEATFPWGEFFIQYVATKPSNGLRSECLFTEAVYLKLH
ncbi:hypothetical protein LSAT2_002371, partial [Lamellibrachia satsuma]